MNGKQIILSIIMIVIMVLVPVSMYFSIMMPAETNYKQKFGSHVTMAKDQATFEGMEEQIHILWNEMNETFEGDDFEETYNTWWWPDRNYENSLQAQEDYFKTLLKSINKYKLMYKNLLENTTSMMEDWYYKAINNLRKEMDREGGLDWALKDAYYLNKETHSYWCPLYMIIIVIILLIILFIGLVYLN